MMAHQTDAVETFYRLYGSCRRHRTTHGVLSWLMVSFFRATLRCTTAER